jgi:death-on-curing family protein
MDGRVTVLDEDAVVFLTLDQVVEIHHDAIAEYSPEEPETILDQGLLESAVGQPQQTFDSVFLYSTVPEMAAQYIISVARNHPFTNGNKRTGFAACSIFLLSSDKWVPVDPVSGRGGISHRPCCRRETDQRTGGRDSGWRDEIAIAYTNHILGRMRPRLVRLLPAMSVRYISTLWKVLAANMAGQAHLPPIDTEQGTRVPEDYPE